MKTLLRVCLVLFGAIALSTGEIDKKALKYAPFFYELLMGRRVKKGHLVQGKCPSRRVGSIGNQFGNSLEFVESTEHVKEQELVPLYSRNRYHAWGMGESKRSMLSQLCSCWANIDQRQMNSLRFRSGKSIGTLALVFSFPLGAFIVP